MYLSQNIAERIKLIAKQKNITIKEMLSACELSKNAISSMLSGGSIPKSENLAKIADYLDCSVDYLLGRDETISDNYIVSDKYEKMVIDQFRTLSDQGKEYILQTLAMAVNQYKKDSTFEYNERKVN